MHIGFLDSFFFSFYILLLLFCSLIRTVFVVCASIRETFRLGVVVVNRLDELLLMIQF